MTGISVVIPVYNSEESIGKVVRRLLLLLPSIAAEYEVILVDDGSRDGSWKAIERLAAENPATVRGFNLMRNYGQHNALLAGIRQARFPVTITMDDDLQHPPEEIPILLRALEDGCDVVYGTPEELPHSIWRNLTSYLTKRALAYAMGIKTIRNMSGFRALRTGLRDAFAGYQNPNVQLDVLLSWGTTKFSAAKVHHMPRTIGRSNYNFATLFNRALVVLTGFSTAPLRLASIVGFLFTCLGLIILIYVAGRYLLEGSIPGFPFLASMISIFSGAQLFTLGIFGEYLARIFNRSMDRPSYVFKSATSNTGRPAMNPPQVSPEVPLDASAECAVLVAGGIKHGK
jgi:glycosyltransferase involved in cell wall biosynthesis